MSGMRGDDRQPDAMFHSWMHHRSGTLFIVRLVRAENSGQRFEEYSVASARMIDGVMTIQSPRDE